MIPAGVQVYVASMPVDFRKGAIGLMALVRDGGADPFNGALYVFRSKRADRIKAVWFDGTGVCLFAKTLEDARFCWRDVNLTFDEIRDVEASKTRFLIAYGMILAPPCTQYWTNEICRVQGSLRRLIWRMPFF